MYESNMSYYDQLISHQKYLSLHRRYGTWPTLIKTGLNPVKTQGSGTILSLVRLLMGGPSTNEKNEYQRNTNGNFNSIWWQMPTSKRFSHSKRQKYMRKNWE